MPSTTCWPSFNPRLPLPGGDARRPLIQRFSPPSFQSTPPVAGRRCPAGHRRRSPWAGFNPRLPLPGGDANPVPVSLSNHAVSIHASRCREAMPAVRAQPHQAEQVSIHASRCREAMPSSTAPPSMLILFQSTPPVAGRRCATLHQRGLTMLTFQSTPPVAGRRCRRTLIVSSKSCSFNPRLPLPGGDARRRRWPAATAPVSIHASRCREAMLGLPEPSSILRDGFNPRLPLPGGDALSMRSRHRPSAVSIHASRCREAMHSRDPLRILIEKVSIHASRCREAMPRFRNDLGQFAAVSIHASRCREAMRRNSRLLFRRQTVSIHASRCREAMHLLAQVVVGHGLFQSTPPVAGRRCLLVLDRFDVLDLFQSTPPVAGRRCEVTA